MTPFLSLYWSSSLQRSGGVDAKARRGHIAADDFLPPPAAFSSYLHDSKKHHRMLDATHAGIILHAMRRFSTDAQRQRDDYSPYRFLFDSLYAILPDGAPPPRRHRPPRHSFFDLRAKISPQARCQRRRAMRDDAG